MSISHRNRTSTFCIMYALYLYFLGLSFRSTSKAIEPFEERSHVAVWKWVQRFRPNRIYVRKRVAAFVIDETLIQIGNDVAWLWIAIEPVNRTVLDAYISRERTMLIAEAFLKTLVKVYGKHPVYSDGGTWYPQACNFLGLVHRLHSPFEMSIIERVIQYFKDRTECFDDYYPCIKVRCNLSHVYNWIRLFVFMYDRTKRHKSSISSEL
jgi:putative transposase